MLCFLKRGPAAEADILVAVSLDPRGAQSATIVLPAVKGGIRGHQDYAVENALTGEMLHWVGRQQRIALDPQQPALLAALGRRAAGP